MELQCPEQGKGHMAKIFVAPYAFSDKDYISKSEPLRRPSWRITGGHIPRLQTILERHLPLLG